MFGDGKLCVCKFIFEVDLVFFIFDCVSDVEKINQIFFIGGFGKVFMLFEQGEMFFRIVGKELKFIKVLIGVMDFVIGVLDNFFKFFFNFEDVVEFGKIGCYYVVESMFVLDFVMQKYDVDVMFSYGIDIFEIFFDCCVSEGMVGQEFGD